MYSKKKGTKKTSNFYRCLVNLTAVLIVVSGTAGHDKKGEQISVNILVREKGREFNF